MILNGGIDPDTNATIIPSAQFDVITSAHSIVGGDASAEESTLVYGLGWFRETFIGHDVSEICCYFVHSILMLLYQILWHAGSAPGVSTFIAAAPEDGIGIIVLTNADSKADAISNITDQAAELAFGSGNSSPATVTRRFYQPAPRHDGVTLTARGDDGPPDVDLTGTYYNAGYGPAVLCSVQSTSPSCESVLDAFRSIDPSLSTSTDLFASWVTLLSTHLRFTYTNDSQYLITIGSIYPQGYGRNSTPFSTLIPVAMAEFEVENEKVVGFGWNNIGLDDDDVKRAGSVEETSDVWFVKGT